MLKSLIDINNTFISFYGYNMSYLEFFGTVLNLWSVWLVAHNRILTWPVGNLGVILFGLLFYQIQLYSDMMLQGFFLVSGFYGWWIWAKRGNDRENKVFLITRSSKKALLIEGMLIAVSTMALGFFMMHINLVFPTLFPKPASFAYLDAFCAAMSIAATFLMAHKKIENWYLWITVDVISIGLYSAKGVFLIMILYVMFLGLATNGLLNWRKIMRSSRAAA